MMERRKMSEPFMDLAASRKSPKVEAVSRAERSSGSKNSVAKSIKHAPGVIKSFEDIHRLTASRILAKRLPRGGLPIGVPGISDETCRLLAVEVKRFARACGCASGAAGFFVTSAASIVIAYNLVITQHWRALFYLIASAVIVVPATTVAAKMLGREAARLRFRRNCTRLIGW
jgi:hypothetical protein